MTLFRPSIRGHCKWQHPLNFSATSAAPSDLPSTTALTPSNSHAPYSQILLTSISIQSQPLHLHINPIVDFPLLQMTIHSTSTESVIRQFYLSTQAQDLMGWRAVLLTKVRFFLLTPSYRCWISTMISLAFPGSFRIPNLI